MTLLQGIAANQPGFTCKALVLKKRVIRTCITRFLLLFFLSPLAVFADNQPVNSEQIKTIPLANPATEVTPVQQEKLSEPVTVKTEAKKTIAVKKVYQDKALANVQAIVQTGAIHLALLKLSKQQPDYTPNQERWIRWERERITLLNIAEQYPLLVERVKNLPAGINLSFLYWAKTRQASAYLKLEEFENARQSLTEVIWGKHQHDSEFSNRWLPHWRRMIIHSYLNQGLFKDAHISITRFRQDYGEGDINDIILYARVLLMNNLANEALNVLAGHTRNPEAGMLHLLAQLRKDSRSPRKVLQASLRQMQGDWVKPELKTYLWSIVAEAAQRSDDKLSGIKAMEFVLADADNKNLPQGLFKLSVDDLWNAYVENAIKIGNRAQYLMGDDPAWLNAAEAFDITQPINARSLHAFLILRGQDKKIKAKSIQLFLASLSKNKNGKELVKQLFLHSSHFKSKQTIPLPVRHFLIDYALSETDIRLASELMATIQTSPEDADKFMWQLRRARVLVMGGKINEGADALIELLSQQKQMNVEDADRLMQVVFDLQTVNAHQQAYRVFEQVLLHVDDYKRQREIYYWMADSKKALQQYAEAAALYLESAVLPAKESMELSNVEPGLDPWGQTARYQAATALAKAGLTEDARVLYQKLLDVTREESRIRVIKHQLQQLWLMENQTVRQH